jgi:hypothetical protein
MNKGRPTGRPVSLLYTDYGEFYLIPCAALSCLIKSSICCLAFAGSLSTLNWKPPSGSFGGCDPRHKNRPSITTTTAMIMPAIAGLNGAFICWHSSHY